MITVTKLNKEEMVINAMLIEKIESKPDTVITLISGKQYIVLEKPKDVIEKVTRFYETMTVQNIVKEMNDQS
jgi:flagellar protein FlbD